MKVIGFVLFFLFVFVVLCGLFLVCFSFYPNYLIKTDSSEDLKIGSKLILILAAFSPVVLLQRFNSLVYSIRIEDYIYQSIDIFFNFLKIISISYFVSKSDYNIVGYFITIQSLSLFSGLIGASIAFWKFDYSLYKFLGFLKFSKEMYSKTKSLAFSSLLNTIAWILYFELDSIILSKYYGLRTVAMYAIGFTFLNFTRNLYNIIFSPFLSRFNHFVGENNDIGLIQNFSNLIMVTFPICIIPPLVLSFYMPEIINSWIGNGYATSIFISQLFLITSAFSALSIPITYLILAKSENTILRINAIILPIIFFGSLILGSYYFEKNTLAVSKLVTIFCSFSLTFYFIIKLIGKRIWHLYLNAFKTIIIPLIVMLFIFKILPDFGHIQIRSKQSYFELIWHILPSLIIPIILFYLINPQTRQFLLSKIVVK